MRSIIWTGFSGHGWDDQSVLVLQWRRFLFKNEIDLIDRLYVTSQQPDLHNVLYQQFIPWIIRHKLNRKAIYIKCSACFLSFLLGQYLNKASYMKVCFSIFYINFMLILTFLSFCSWPNITIAQHLFSHTISQKLTTVGFIGPGTTRNVLK